MEIRDRVMAVMGHYGESQSTLSEKLGLSQPTFSRYLAPEHQVKLRQYLWILHDIFPKISRDWLFFGEGNMFGHNALQRRVDALEKNVRKLAVENSRRETRQQRLRRYLQGVRQTRRVKVKRALKVTEIDKSGEQED